MSSSQPTWRATAQGKFPVTQDNDNGEPTTTLH